MKIKTLLIQPPIEDFYTTLIRLFPLGLLHIATPLKIEGFEVKILDTHSPFQKKIIKLPEKFKYIKKFYDENNKSPFRLFGHFYHFGMDWEQIREKIKEYKPHIVGISSLFSPYYEEALKCAQIAKEVNKETITILGGNHPTLTANSLIKKDEIDFIIKGEADFLFKELVTSLAKQKDSKVQELPGVIFKNQASSYLSEKYNIIEDIDELPFNDLTLIENKYNLAMLQTSRGCPLNCGFCAISNLPVKKWRAKTPKRVLEEILYYKNRFNISHIDIEDDNFTGDIKRAIKILDLLKEYGKIKLSAMNGLYSDFLNNEILEKMKEAGFDKINISLVSANYSVRENINRKGSISHFEEIVRYANSLNLEVEVHFIIGIPDEKGEETIKTLLYLSALPCKIGGSIFYPVPNTPIFQRCVENNSIINKDDPSFWRLTLASVESYPNSRNDQITFLYLVRIINFLKYMYKKYLLLNKLDFKEGIYYLEKCNSSFTPKESLGFILAKKFIEDGIIYKGLKRKNEYIFQKEEYLNNKIIERFLRDISYVS